MIFFFGYMVLMLLFSNGYDKALLNHVMYVNACVCVCVGEI